LRYDKVSVDVSICFRYFEENVFFFFLILKRKSIWTSQKHVSYVAAL